MWVLVSYVTQYWRFLVYGDRKWLIHHPFRNQFLLNTLLQIPTHQTLFPLPIESTALLIIDMQNDFCHPQGFSGELGFDLTPIRAIIPRLQRVLDWARQKNVLVVFTRESHRPDLSDLTPSKQARYTNAGSPIGQKGAMGRYLVQGEPGAEIIDELTPLPSDLQLDKPAHSIFVNTELDENLRSRGITHLLVTGVTTECCVLASYRHANDLGFYSLLLEDCCAAFHPQDHAAAIHILLAEGGVLGWVTSSDHLLQHSLDP